MHALEDFLDAVQHEVEFSIVDRHEFERQAAIGAFRILPDKTISLEPSNQRRFNRIDVG